MSTLLPESESVELTADQTTQLTDMLYSNWVWRAVHALMSHKDFDSSIPWLVKQLDVTFEEVAEALEGLEKLRLVSKENGTYKAEEWRQLIPEIDATLERKLENHKITSAQIANKISMDPNLPMGFYDCIYFSTDELTRKLYWKIRKAIEEWEKESAGLEEVDGVFGMAYTMARLSDKKDS